MSETVSLIEAIEGLAESVVQTSEVLVSICKSLERQESDIKSLVSDLSKSEEKSDSIFESVAEQIMSVEFLNVNPDYLLDIARQIDGISDLIERAGLLFQYLGNFSDQEILALLNDVSIQIQKIIIDVIECLKRLESGEGNVNDFTEILSEREKAVDALREELNSRLVTDNEITIEQKIWLKEIFADLDQIADLGRDLGIVFRVVGVKLQKQRTLTLKNSFR